MKELHIILGAGPLGRHTAQALLAKGHQVRILCRSGKMETPPAGAEVIKADIHQIPQVLEICQGAKALYQCAQPAYHRWVQEFPALQSAALTLAEKTGAKMIAAENLYIYGHTQGVPMTGTSPIDPCSKKGRVRAAMTEELFQAHAEGRVQAASVRGSNFFGPWDEISASLVFKPALKGKTLTFLGRLDQPHSFTYVKDFGLTLAEAGTKDEALGWAWPVPSGGAVTQQFLVNLLEKELGRPLKATSAGRILLTFAGIFSPSAKESREMLYEFNEPFILDASETEKAFGQKPTPMEIRIKETLDWLRTRE